MTTLHEIAATLAVANDAASANSSSAADAAAPVGPAFGLAPANPAQAPAKPSKGGKGNSSTPAAPASPAKPVRDLDRREHRRHDLDHQALTVDRWDGARRAGQPFGRIVDLSAGGVRIRTEDGRNIRPDNHIRVRIELPDYAGISPFIDHASADGAPRPKREWVGWMAVTRVKPVAGNISDVAGRLVDMDEMDRGMLGLYLSTQPLAA